MLPVMPRVRQSVHVSNCSVARESEKENHIHVHLLKCDEVMSTDCVQGKFSTLNCFTYSDTPLIHVCVVFKTSHQQLR